MSIKIMSRVWEHATEEKGSSLLLLLALADFADDNGLCWPSTTMLAQKIRMSERQTQRMADALARRDHLFVVDGDGRGHRSRYVVLTGVDRSRIPALLARLLPDCPEEISAYLERENASKGVNLSPFGREKGDIAMSPFEQEKGVNLSPFEAGKGDISAGKGDIAMSNDYVMIRHEDPPPPTRAQEETTTHSNAGGGGGSLRSQKDEPEKPNATVQWLISPVSSGGAGISFQIARLCQDLPLDRVQLLVEEKRKEGARGGAIALYLREVAANQAPLLHPPSSGPPPAPVRQKTVDELYAEYAPKMRRPP